MCFVIFDEKRKYERKGEIMKRKGEITKRKDESNKYYRLHIQLRYVKAAKEREETRRGDEHKKKIRWEKGERTGNRKQNKHKTRNSKQKRRDHKQSDFSNPISCP